MRWQYPLTLCAGDQQEQAPNVNTTANLWIVAECVALWGEPEQRGASQIVGLEYRMEQSLYTVTPNLCT